MGKPTHSVLNTTAAMMGNKTELIVHTRLKTAEIGVLAQSGRGTGRNRMFTQKHLLKYRKEVGCRPVKRIQWLPVGGGLGVTHSRWGNEA